MRHSLGLLVCLAVVSLAGAADSPPPAVGRPLSAAEEGWLKEVKDFLKTPAEKTEFEEEFRADTHTGRKGIYDFFRKALAARAKAKVRRELEAGLGEEDAIEMVPPTGGAKAGDKPPPRPAAGERGRPLTGEEARWLRDLVEEERDQEEKKVIASEFRQECPLGRRAMYELYLKRKKGGRPPRG